MKATLVLAMMLQNQAEAGQMALVKKFTAAGCASTSEFAQEYIDVDICFNYDGAYVTATCNADGDLTAAKYSDSMCQTVDTAFNGYGYTSGLTSTTYYSGACVAQAESASSTATHHEKVVCMTLDTASVTYYSDTSCTVAKTDAGATGMGALNACEYATNGNGGIEAHQSQVIANGSIQTSAYTNKACTGTGTVIFMIDPNMCTYDGDKSLYYKWDGNTAAGGSSGGSSGSSSNGNTSNGTTSNGTTGAPKSTASKSTLQRGFLALPLFMGVVAFLI